MNAITTNVARTLFVYSGVFRGGGGPWGNAFEMSFAKGIGAEITFMNRIVAL